MLRKNLLIILGLLSTVVAIVLLFALGPTLVNNSYTMSSNSASIATDNTSTQISYQDGESPSVSDNTSKTVVDNIVEEEEGDVYAAKKVVVSFESPAFIDGRLSDEARSILNSCRSVRADDSTIKQINDTECVLDVLDGYSVSNAVAELSYVDGIEFADADWIFSLVDDVASDSYDQDTSTLTSSLTNDPYLPNQWALSSTWQTLGSAWSQAKANKQVSVAVLDSGIQEDHPDLKNNIIYATSIPNDGFGPEDRYGHGTHVAGIVAAESDNGIGVSGVSYNAGIVSIRVFQQVGTDWYAYSSDIASGINRVVSLKDTYNIKVINMSLGIPDTSRSTPPSGSSIMTSALGKAHEAGITICAASGNKSSTTQLTACEYPSYIDYCIAVGSIDSTRSRSYFSNGDASLDVVAPGGSIYSTYPGSTYTTMSGTSMATPFVSGIAALCYTINPSITPDQVYSALTSTATDLGDSGFDVYYGYGLVNPNAVLTSAKPATEVAYTLNYSTSGDVSGSVAVADDRGVSYTSGASVTPGRHLTLSWSGITNSASDGAITMITSIAKNGSEIYSIADIDRTNWKTINSYWRTIYNTNEYYATYDAVKSSVEAGGSIDLGQIETDTTIAITYTKLQPIYRLYNRLTSEHLFTTSKSEYDNLAALCTIGRDFWIPEGIDWFSYQTQNSNTSVVYRLYNAQLGKLGRNSHYYTSDAAEASRLVANSGWIYDTFSGSSNVCYLSGGNIGIFTCYNEALGSAHHYTSSSSEWESLAAAGWNLERDKNNSGTGFLRGVVSAK